MYNVYFNYTDIVLIVTDKSLWMTKPTTKLVSYDDNDEDGDDDVWDDIFAFVMSQ